MASRRLFLPIILAAFLLFSQVFARELEEKPAAAADKKDPDPNVDDAKYFPGGYYKHFPIPYHRRCKYHCGYKGCCSEEEFAVFSLTQMNDFDDDKHGGSGYGYGRGGYGYGPGYGYGHGGYGYRQPPPCHYRCGYRCCSAEEYAEYVQAGN